MSQMESTNADIGPETKWEVREFLANEAGLLDNHELEAWLDLVTDDIEYKIPTRLTRAVGEEQPEFSNKGYHMKESKRTLESRIQRYEREYAWAENPPTRIRRFVSNFRIEPDGDDELLVKTNLLMTRLDGDNTEPDIITAERHDTLRRVDGDLKLAKRVAYPDYTAMGTKSLTVFM